MGTLTPRGTVAGFSLVEALIALTILSAGVLLMGSTLGVTSKATRDSLDAIAADHLVRHKVEELRAASPGDLRDGGESIVLDRVRYTRRWTVRRDTPDPGTATIAVDVSWSDYIAPLTDVGAQTVTGALNDPVGSLERTLSGDGRVHRRAMTFERGAP